MRQKEEKGHRKTRRLEHTGGWKAHRLFLADGLAMGSRACDVKERLFLGGGERRRRGGDIAPSGKRQRWGGGGLTSPPREALDARGGADCP